MATRDVGPFLAKVRAFLLGRNHQNNLRFRKEMAPRTIPPADLPPGPSHKLGANYYFSRESRRGVTPPEILAPHQTLLGNPDTKVAELEKRPKSKTPGPYYNHTV